VKGVTILKRKSLKEEGGEKRIMKTERFFKNGIYIAMMVLMLIFGVSYVLATVSGSPHDLRNGSSGDICAFCHTPHSGTGDYPLWNRSQASVTYSLYNSNTFDMGPTTQPRFPSSLCLTCHNGQTSSLVNYPGPGSTAKAPYTTPISSFLDSWTNLGTDLTNDHPVSFNYNQSADLDNNGFPGTVNTRFIDGSITDYPLYGSSNNGFECATCHSVHDTASYPDKGTNQVYFLRTTNYGSAMCLDCHTNR